MQSPVPILFIDDDPIFCEYFESVAKPYNLSLEIAHTFEEGKRLILEKTYSAYIIDANLPDGSGFDLAELVRQKKEKTVQIAVISGVFRDSESFRVLKENLQIDFVIDKPIPTGEIQSLLFKLCKPKEQVKESLESALGRLKEKYDKMIPGILKDLEELIKKVKENPNQETITALRQSVHKIAGSAGSIGYPNVSVLCKAWELNLIKHLEEPLKGDWLSSLDDYLRKIKFEYQVIVAEGDEKKFFIDTTGSKGRLPLYIVDSDRALLTALEKEQALFEMNVLSEWDPKKAMEHVAEPDFNPRIVVVGETFLGSTITGKEIIAAVREKPGHFKTSFGVILEKEDLKKRADLAKEGISYVLKKPISADLFLNSVRGALAYEEHPGFKVLVVDDDPFTNEFITLALSEIGIEVRSLTEGTLLYETLQSFKPNLLILDIYLPGYNGVELLQTLRSDIHYQNMLIIIVTASQDTALLKDAYAVNVDDIIHKPLDKKILQMRILSMAKRFAYQGQFQNRDPITGLPNEKALHIYVHELLLGPEHNRVGTFLALIEIDRFRELLALSSEVEMNHFLSFFSNLLLTQMNEYGYTASLGGGKFAVVSEPIDLSSFKQHLETLFKKAQESLLAKSKLTFSTGVTAFPIHYATMEAVFQSAENALNEARQQGRETPAKIVAHALDAAAVEKRHVILLDSDKDLQEILKSSFESHGISVSTYQLGESFLNDLLIKQHPLPPLIIMERLLPDMDGIDILKRIHQKYPVQIPLIFLTTLSSDKDVFEGLKAGALDYITKPFNLRQLVQKSLGALAR